MLLEHLGKMREIDPVQAAVELSIICALQRCGPLKQSDLWFRSSAQPHGRTIYQQSLDSLVEGGHIVRCTTRRRGVFAYRMKREDPRERAATREEASRA